MRHSTAPPWGARTGLRSLRAGLPVLLVAVPLAVTCRPSAAQQLSAAAASSTQPDARDELRDRIKALVEQELQKRLAPADSWDVDVRATPEELQAGELPTLTVRGVNLRL